MSNMLKKGRRLKAREDKKIVKKSTKAFYKQLGELDRVSKLIDREEVTEDNLKKLFEQHSDMPIDRLGEFYLKGKLGLYEDLGTGLNDFEDAKED